MSDQPAEAADSETPDVSVEQRIDDAGDSGRGELSDDDVERLEAEREERLDPANRPEGAEVDNSDREFDPEVGLFTDSEGYDEARARVDDERAAGDESGEAVVDTDEAAESSPVESE